MLNIPIEQIIIGAFALFGAVVTGFFSVYNTKIGKKLSQVEKKTSKNETLTAGNALLDQIVPALERKDEALDKIAEILDNILTTQELTSKQLRSITLILENRCQAIELVKALESLSHAKRRHDQIDKLKEELDKDDTKEILEELIETFECDDNSSSK